MRLLVTIRSSRVLTALRIAASRPAGDLPLLLASCASDLPERSWTRNWRLVTPRKCAAASRLWPGPKPSRKPKPKPRWPGPTSAGPRNGPLPDWSRCFIASPCALVRRPAATAASMRSAAAPFSAASSLARVVPRRLAASSRNALRWATAFGRDAAPGEAGPRAAAYAPPAPARTATPAAPMTAFCFRAMSITRPTTTVASSRKRKNRPPARAHDEDERGDDRERERAMGEHARRRAERRAERVADERERGGPGRGAEQAVRQEAAERELRGAGRERRHGPDEPDEAPDEDRLAAMAGEEPVHGLQPPCGHAEPGPMADEERTAEAAA